jgi:dTDP-glucose 4,6-dehydratase
MYVREWLAVEDLCDAVALAAGGTLPAGVYHCSAGVRLNVLEVIELVADALGTEPRWEHVTDRLVHDCAYAMDATRLRSYGWVPQIDAREAIADAAKAMAHALEAGETLLGATQVAGVG